MSLPDHKPKIKSIVPTNFPIKVLKNGKRVLIRSELDGHRPSSVTRKKNLISKNTTTNIQPNESSKLPSEISNLVLKNDADQLSESETLSDESFVNFHSKYLNGNKGNDSIQVNDCVNKLQKLDFENANNYDGKKNEMSNIQFNTKIETKELSNLNDNNCECSDLEIKKIIDGEQPKHSNELNKKSTCLSKCKYKVSKKNNNLRFNKFSNDIEICKENKENLLAKNKFNRKQESQIKTLNDVMDPNDQILKNVSIRSANANKNSCMMPCKTMKSVKCNTKSSKVTEKKSQVKKRSVFISSGKNCDLFSQNAFLSKSISLASNTTNNKDSFSVNGKKQIFSSNILSQPEYNSTICVMKKLKEIETEKIVPSLENLPPEYKNLIYGKVSNALDFAPYEIIYKDLINLSIDTNKLPHRLTRSKDPEPRDKDIIPKLSDFYKPRCIEQYFVIANPITPCPVNVNILSAFKINKKINSWKKSRDNHL